jgi:hypothetical protein
VNLFEYNYEDMVTSMMLGFHLTDGREFELFHAELKQLEAKFGADNLPLSLAESTAFEDEAAPAEEFEAS